MHDQADRAVALAELRRACSEKQARCAEAYLETGSMAEAARRAGYGGKGSDLSRAGRRALARPAVAAYLDALRAETLGEVRTMLGRVRDRLSRIAFGEPVPQPVGRGGKLKEKPAAVMAQVKALELLARMCGALDPRLKVEIEQPLRNALMGIRRRVSPEAFEELLEALATVEAIGEGKA